MTIDGIHKGYLIIISESKDLLNYLIIVLSHLINSYLTISNRHVYANEWYAYKIFDYHFQSKFLLILLP